MKQVLDEIRLTICIICLGLAVKVAPPSRQESTLMLYYISALLKHMKQLKGDNHEKKGQKVG